ncbi:MAG: AMP-binding protein [Lachnospiraceae bacterium]|nr:AMP-binding protein [Lachnospiraceae bacterium]
MKIYKEYPAKDEIMFIVNGRIDTITSPALREEIAAIPSDIRRVIIDFKNVDYISSAGLRELLICRKKYRDDAMSVINVSKEVEAIFATTGFDTLIPIVTEMEPVEDNRANFEKEEYIYLSFKDFLKNKLSSRPDSDVIIYEGVNYTWSDIDKASDIIAHDLSAKGVHKGSHVGICGINTPNWVFTFYAIQKLGGIALLINPSMRAEEVIRCATVGDADFICLGNTVEIRDLDKFKETVKETTDCTIKDYYLFGNGIDLTARYSEIGAYNERFELFVESDDPCVMIFTSGSTGIPKGVLLSSYNILNAAVINSQDQTLNNTDKTCLILPLFHIFGLVAGLMANSVADSVIYIPKDIRTDTLIELISREKCTIFHSVPTMLIALMKNKNFDNEKLSSIRCTIISGAAATEAQIQMFKQRLPNDHFLSSYGLSEMAPVSITKYEDSDEHVLHTVGLPVRNISIKIADHITGEECKQGESGEILVQGYNLMAGYYKRALDDQSIDEEGWLHTGDLGYINKEGYLCLSGRLKELIIRGGENIMPGEVEAVISQLDMIGNVKVIGVPSEFFGEEVAACIILNEGESFDEDIIRKELEGKLSRFKIPSFFIVYESFPMLGTGKIDAVSLKSDVCAKIGKPIH